MYWPDDDVLRTMTYSEAKRTIESMENRRLPVPPGFTTEVYNDDLIKDIIISSDKVTWNSGWLRPFSKKYIKDVDQSAYWSNTSYFKSMNIRVAFRDYWQIYTVFLGVGESDRRGQEVRPAHRKWDIQFWDALDKDEAVSLANAFYVLNRYAEGYNPAAGKNAPQDSEQ